MEHIINVQDFYEDDLTLDNLDEFKKFIKRRFEEDSNRFIVSCGARWFPNVRVYVKGANAVAYYTSSDETTMYASVGAHGKGPDITFLDYSGNSIRSTVELPHESIISSELAEMCLIEFARTGRRLDTIAWLEL